jgi:hypothetical protein
LFYLPTSVGCNATPQSVNHVPRDHRDQVERTGWETLLEFIGLLCVLENQSVQVSVAPDLELDVLCLCRLLDSSRCEKKVSAVLYGRGWSYMKHPSSERSRGIA